MQRRLTVFAISAVILAATGGAPIRAPSVTAVAVVQQLYRDYAWELLFFPPPRQWNVLTNEPPAVLKKYFDDELTSLIARDQACVAREKGECNIDGSPSWASNDPEASELQVVATRDSTLV